MNNLDEVAAKIGIPQETLELGGAMNDAVLEAARRIGAAGGPAMDNPLNNLRAREDLIARYTVSALFSAALAIARENKEAEGMLFMMMTVTAADASLPEPRTGTDASRARLAELMAAAEGN